ncbi:inosamine-phosphate amidinotransferase 1 [Streptomyces sp. NPDC005125]
MTTSLYTAGVAEGKPVSGPAPVPAAAPVSAVPMGRGVHSFDEFTRLREIVIGNPLNARIPTTRDPSMWLNLYPDLSYAELDKVQTGQFPQQIIEETLEDLDVLIRTLEELGIVVHQAEAHDHGREFATPDWTSDGFYSYCPRDIALIAGTTIIETPSPMRARYFESRGLQRIFQRYLQSGSAWISAPKPRLCDEMFDIDDEGLPVLGELEPVFDAANILRCGRDVFYQVSGSGNELGLTWLQSVLRLLGDFTVHPLRGVYGYTHIDSTIAFLRPGLVLLNPERATEDNLPEPLRGWDKLWCPPMEEPPVASPYPLSSPWLGMNLLMVDSDVAIVDADQPELIRALERQGISALPHSLRHGRVLGGGFHCVSLDLVRDGQLVDYFE